jgi:hypothetical protein
MKKFLAIAVISLLFIALGSFFGCKSNSESPAPAPTLSCSTTLGYPADDDDNYYVGSKMLAVSGTASSDDSVYQIGVKLQADTNFACAIYADNGGTPGTMLSESGITAGTTGWNLVNIPPAAITSGNIYWIVAVSEGAGIRDKDGTSVGLSKAYTWGIVVSSGLLDNPAGFAAANCDMKLYANTCH